MSKRRVFEATRSDGVVVRRTSDRKVYSHCVAIWVAEHQQVWGDHRITPAQWINPQWCGRRDLAEKTARYYNNQPGHRAEVLEAREVSK